VQHSGGKILHEHIVDSTISCGSIIIETEFTEVIVNSDIETTADALSSNTSSSVTIGHIKLNLTEAIATSPTTTPIPTSLPEADSESTPVWVWAVVSVVSIVLIVGAVLAWRMYKGKLKFPGQKDNTTSEERMLYFFN